MLWGNAMKAFVAGATGATGSRIVQELVRHQIPVRALVRDREVAQTILPPEAELVLGDVLDPTSLPAAIADSTVVLSATGARPSFDVAGPYKVDYWGTKHLVDAAKVQGIDQFVLVSSLCVSRLVHPLNLFWLVLFWKRQGEQHLQASGLVHTIVRPGGLRNEDDAQPILMRGADTLFEGSIPRTKVAQICVAALFESAARNKTLEVVTQEGTPEKPLAELFASVA